MTLESYTMVSVSVAATLFSLFIIFAIVVGILAIKRLQKILTQLETISQTGVETTKTVQAFLESTTQNMQAFTQTFLSFQGLKDIFTTFVEAYKRNKEERS